MSIRLGYISAMFPGLSWTFPLREVSAVRARGVQIVTFSVRRSEQKDLLSEENREAFRSTYALVPPKWTDLIASHAIAGLRHPRQYAATLVRALRLAPAGARGRLWQLFYFVEAIMLWRQCTRCDISHLHAHMAHTPADVSLLAADFGGRVQGNGWSWSFTMHGPYEFYNVDKHRLTAKVVDARFVVCISDFARSQLMTLVPEVHWNKLRVVHCGLNTAEFGPSERPSADGPIEILSIARLDHEKGQTVLLEAIAELARRGMPVHAVIAGTGPKEREIERLAEALGVKDRVELPGAVGQDEIRARFAAASIFCLPSFAEGLPGVLIEAMAMEVPVVAARIMGTPELVDDGVSGFLVPPARADLLADALAELVESPELRTRMGAAGRQKVQDDFDIRTSAEQLEALFREMGLANDAVDA